LMAFIAAWWRWVIWIGNDLPQLGDRFPGKRRAKKEGRSRGQRNKS